MVAALVTLTLSNRSWMLPGQLTEAVRLRITMFTVAVGLALSELADGEAEAIKGAPEAGAVVGTKRIQLSWISPMKSSAGVFPVLSWFIVRRSVFAPLKAKVWTLP